MKLGLHINPNDTFIIDKAGDISSVRSGDTHSKDVFGVTQ